MTASASGARRSGVLTALDICVAPRAAFANLRDMPTWVWAFVIAAGVGMVCAAITSPVVTHVVARELPARLAAAPQIASMPPDQREALIAQQVSLTQSIARFSFVFVPLGLALGCLIQAFVLLIASAAGKGDATFKRCWALAVNASIVGTGISSFALMVIVLIRGSGGFASSAAIENALPGLGMFVPAHARAAAAFLGVINVFAIWNVALLAFGLPIVARVSRITGIIAAAIILMGTGLFPLIGAAFQK